MKKKKDIDFKYNLKVYWSFLKKYKLLFVGLLIVILLFEASRIVDRFLFKVLIDRGSEFVAGTLGRSPFVSILLVLGGILLAVGISRSLLKWLHIHMINRLDANIIYELKRKLFNHIIKLSYDFHTTHKTGSLISRLVRGGRAVEMLTDVIIFNVLPLVLQLVMVTTALFYYSWQSAVAALITVVVFIGYSFFIQHGQMKANVEANKAEDTEKAHISDYFTNIDSIKYFGKEESIKSRFAKVSNFSRLAMIKHWDYYRWLDAGHMLILTLSTLAIIYFPLVDFLNGEITLGTLTFIYTVFGNVIFPLFSFVHGVRNYYRAMADFESLFEYAKMENEIKDRPDARKLKIRDGNIEFKNVDFAYQKRKLFSNLNLKIARNKKVALVGHSGCGKTTFVRLLYRLYDVKEGAVQIDGKDIRDVKKESLRSELSIVPQECILFDDTVYNNVAFSKPGASKKEVMRAMRFAQLDNVVKNFPKREHTIVGERGVKLSGGEKQRVSIARAILANKKVLVLDEATSSLDSQTEHEIQQDLQKLMKGRTSIIIAHRLSTIMKADQIIVMRRGKIIQMGSHKQLLKEEGPYRKLWKMQKGGYIK